MGEAEIAGKLAFIARATAEDLEGWVWARVIDKRPMFDGEAEAIARRQRDLMRLQGRR